ncbi:hypothetical protein CHS0354_022607 [Potamilus streckersoni]|uniref:Uncharacterized protein n=1 Tax=Potamilus streckersoni TaxID=2493646 RepID=A0AAE0RXZ7_9BIVA|nr:hypothetical protein CHS0354_022607 [Potamilus streckersoni]
MHVFLHAMGKVLHLAKYNAQIIAKNVHKDLMSHFDQADTCCNTMNSSFKRKMRIMVLHYVYTDVALPEVPKEFFPGVDWWMGCVGETMQWSPKKFHGCRDEMWDQCALTLTLCAGSMDIELR